MTTRRRMGDPDSATAHTILDGAERVLQARGYGAITSRSIAEEVGLKHQLVYYYFNDINDLLLAAFQRRMARGIERLKENACSDQPLRAIWDNFNDAIDAGLDFEYMALANHHDGVRQEIVKFLMEARAIQTEIIESVYSRKGIDPALVPPGALAFLLTYTSMSLTREEGIGFTVAHEEIKAMVERLLGTTE